MVDQVSRDVFEANGLHRVASDSVEDVNELTDEIHAVRQLRVSQDGLHDLDELVEVHLLARNQLEVLRDLQQLNLRQVVDQVDLV